MDIISQSSTNTTHRKQLNFYWICLIYVWASSTFRFKYHVITNRCMLLINPWSLHSSQSHALLTLSRWHLPSITPFQSKIRKTVFVVLEPNTKHNLIFSRYTSCICHLLELFGFFLLSLWLKLKSNTQIHLIFSSPKDISFPSLSAIY